MIAIVLASGKSTRMFLNSNSKVMAGRAKALLDWPPPIQTSDAPVLRYSGSNKVIDHILQSICGAATINSVVLVGSKSVTDYLRPKLYLFIRPIQLVINESPDLGQMHAVHLGIITALQTTFAGSTHTLSTTPPAAMIALGDQPLLTSADYDLIAQTFLRSERGLLRPCFQQQFGNPSVIAAKYFQEILDCDPADTGPRFLFKKYDEDVSTIEMPNAHCLKDLDTPEDYYAHAHA